MRGGLEAYNVFLLGTCASEGLLCVDAAAEKGHAARHFYDDFHFSEYGAASLARVVGEGLQDTAEVCSKVGG